jgi:glycosyltransferase 2 family protein
MMIILTKEILKNNIIKVAKFITFLIIGIGLFLYVYRDQNMSGIMNELSKIDYFWIILSILVTFLSHLSRAIRWQMLIETLGQRPKLGYTLGAVLIGYLANMAFPRLGEISKCGIISKYEKAPFAKVFGTVIIERVIDIASTFILLGIVLFTQTHIVSKFFENNPSVTNNLKSLLSSGVSLIVLLTIFLTISFTIYYFRNSYKHLKIYIKAISFIKNMVDGLKSIKGVKKKKQFVFHSIFIWLIYFISMYFSFLAFEPTKNLGMLPILTVFVMGTFGMVAPVQGGIGTWHFMVIGTLFIYSVGTTDAKIFALVTHGAMTFSTIIYGTIAIILLPFYNLKNQSNLNKTD